MRADPAGIPSAGDGPAPSGAGRWVAAGTPTAWPACARFHLMGSGRMDERDRRLSHEELAVAELLAAGGHLVRSLPESRRGGRRADLEVCGSPVEIKSFAPVAERGRPPSARSVYNKLVDASGQARAVVLWGPGSGLTLATVRAGLDQLAAAGRAPLLSSVRAVGDGFDLSWSRRAALGVGVGSGHRRPTGRSPGLGL